MPLIQPINPAQLPVVLCGPIVRRVTRTRAHIWVALSTGDPVQLTVFDPGGNATAAPAVTPLRVGQALWIAVLSLDGVTNGEFAAGSTYEYAISSAAWPANRSPNWADFALQPREPAVVHRPAGEHSGLRSSIRPAAGRTPTSVTPSVSAWPSSRAPTGRTC